MIGLSHVCLVLAWALLGSQSAWAVEISEVEIQNRRCMNCHGQSKIAEMSPSERAAMNGSGATPAPDAPARRPALYMPSLRISGTHNALRCVDCHKDAETLPHAMKLPDANCNTACHTQAMAGFAQSAHAPGEGVSGVLPTCKTCHGAHDVLPADDRKSLTHPLNINKVCGDCHGDHDPVGPTVANQDSALARETRGPVHEYLDSAHGRALTRGGLAVAATCSDCHDPHRVLPSTHADSTVSRKNVPDTCGKCHLGTNEQYAKSVHGMLMEAGDPNAPICTDCHTAHAVTRTDVPAFKLDIVNQCGTCHDKPLAGGRATLYETYRRSYHGQATQLGFERAARCSDCHGAHDILAVNDPASRVAEGPNRVAMCQSCHPKADAKFAEFHAHADYRDRERYPILWGVWMYFVVMMSASFGFFGLHSILWFIRSAIERIKHGPHPAMEHGQKSIKRFNKIDRLNHAFVIISFFGLTITGLPLLFADQAWGQWLARVLGGAQSAGFLHRVFAVMLILNFVVHGVGLIRRIKRYGFFNLLFGPTTMLFTPKDARDALGMFKWFFVGGKKPKFDRWTYWEKFDYMAEVGGSGIIGLSGLVLWFPEFFSAFMPGWMFNVAMIVHGYEAMLAIGFIFTIHFFNAHLRLEKFPVDDVMFTGRLPEEEFKHERGAEYDRMVATGEIEALRVDPPPAWYRPLAVTAGIVAMAIGTTLVVLIILAGLGWL